MPDLTGPRLTVLIITYNHEAYIRRAVESILMQTLSERYQVVVADDGSTDNTRAMIAALFAAAPDGPPVRFLDHAVNRGVTANYRRSFQACETDYVAVLEGDDYWIHPRKLAMQMDFLDEHWECEAVSANYFVYDEKVSRFVARASVSKDFGHLDARTLIDDNLIGNFSTCMYRLSALRSIPEVVFDDVAYDWGINICVARHGFIGFLHTPLSVYRIHNKGTWNRLNKQERIATQLRVIEHYNRSTDFVFDAEFERLAERLTDALHERRKKPWRRRIIAILIACFPPGIIWTGQWLGRTARRYLLPPIIPIAIRKMRKGRV